jgi:hypothetical protein
MNILFIFLDGVGLGEDDPERNPFVSANTPTLDHLLSGQKLLAKNAPYYSRYFTLISIDAQMGVEGLPQSATGQATLLTGLNFPKILDYHYGPKPNQCISEFFVSKRGVSLQKATDIKSISIFSRMRNAGKNTCLLNAYPPSYFTGINSRKRNHSLIPLAASSSGIRLFDQNDLIMRRALSADFTGQGWRDHLNIYETPILKPDEAGLLMATLSKDYRFSMFEFWETDIVGHKQNFSNAFKVIEKFDLVLKGLINNWDFENDAILITSDHGNMEDLSTRRHTANQVPAIFIGPPEIHSDFSKNIRSIGDIAPFIFELLND